MDYDHSLKTIKESRQHSISIIHTKIKNEIIDRATKKTKLSKTRF